MPKITSILTVSDSSGTEGGTAARLPVLLAEGKTPFSLDRFFVNRTDPIAQNSHLWGKRVAITSKFGTQTFEELDIQADKIATLLLAAAEMTGRGLVAIYTALNHPSFFAISLACRRAGLAYTNFVNTLEPDEMLTQLYHHPYSLLFADETMLHKIARITERVQQLGIGIVGLGTNRREVTSLEKVLDGIQRPRAALPDDTPRPYFGPVLYTSGTVKDPKRIEVRPGATTGSVANKFFQVGPNDKHLVLGKLYHGAALSWSQGHLRRGAHIILADTPGFKFYPERILQRIEDDQITTLWICPSWLQLLIDAKKAHPKRYDTASIRNIYVSAAPFSERLKQAAVDAFGPIFFDNYAATETGSISILKPNKFDLKAHTVGQPLPQVSVEIKDDHGLNMQPNKIGRIFVKSPMTNEDYVEVGDDGYLDDEGYLTVVGRTSERIMIGGSVYYPRLLEKIIDSNEAFRESHLVWDKQNPKKLHIFLLRKKDVVPVTKEIEMRLKVSFELPEDIEFTFYQLNYLPRKPYKIDHKKLVSFVELQTRIHQDLQEFENIINSPSDNFIPATLLDMLSQIPWLQDLWNETASPQFNLSLKNHTLRVLLQYETYFHAKYSHIIHPHIMRLILSVHDLGKPIAVKEKNTTKEHIETCILIQRTFNYFGINPKITDFTCTLVSFVFGHYVRGVRLIPRMKLALDAKNEHLVDDFEELIETAYKLAHKDARIVIDEIKTSGKSPTFLRHLKDMLIQKIKEATTTLGIRIMDFYDTLVMYHQCDASTYTTHTQKKYDAQEPGKLDDLFEINEDTQSIQYNTNVTNFITDVRETLALEPDKGTPLTEMLSPMFVPMPTYFNAGFAFSGR